MSDRTAIDEITAYAVRCERHDCPYESEAWNRIDADKKVRDHDAWHELIEAPLPPGKYAVELSPHDGPDGVQRWRLRIAEGPQRGRILYDGTGWFEVPDPLDLYWVEFRSEDDYYRVFCHELGCTFKEEGVEESPLEAARVARRVARRHAADHMYDTEEST